MKYYINIELDGEINSLVETKGDLEVSETCIEISKEDFVKFMKKKPLQDYKYSKGKISKRTTSDINKRKVLGEERDRVILENIKKKKHIKLLNEKIELGLTLTQEEQNWLDQNK